MRQFATAITPQHQQCVVIFLEHLVVPHFVRGDHVEVLLEEFLPRVFPESVSAANSDDRRARSSTRAAAVARMSTVHSILRDRHRARTFCLMLLEPGSLGR